MAVTPEGRVKAVVKKLLAELGEHVWYDMPVPGGYGKSTLDFLGCAGGVFFAIETKAEDTQEPTDRQKACMRAIEAAGGASFAICGTDDPDLKALRKFLSAATGVPT